MDDYTNIDNLKDIAYSIKLCGEIAELKAELEKINEPPIYHSCDHLEKYRFIDKDGYLRCSDCHKVIEQIKPQTKL